VERKIKGTRKVFAGKIRKKRYGGWLPRKNRLHTLERKNDSVFDKKGVHASSLQIT
jgi:hypothetical protein